MINKFKILLEIQLKYIINLSLVRNQGVLKIGISSKIINSKIIVAPGSKLVIGNNCIIKNTIIYVNGTMEIGDFNHINNADKNEKIEININKGNFIMNSHNRIQSEIKIRFNGRLAIGKSNNINWGSELRVDEHIEIGDYNQISYNCNIWDTNTHNIYKSQIRRNLTDKHYPLFGYEFEKPDTKRVKIGNDCWLGKNCSILKGTSIGDNSVLGYATTLVNYSLRPNTTVTPKLELRLTTNLI